MATADREIHLVVRKRVLWTRARSFSGESLPRIMPSLVRRNERKYIDAKSIAWCREHEDGVTRNIDSESTNSISSTNISSIITRISHSHSHNNNNNNNNNKNNNNSRSSKSISESKSNIGSNNNYNSKNNNNNNNNKNINWTDDDGISRNVVVVYFVVFVIEEKNYYARRRGTV
ncbi:putative uncharacterized protein DDB_G0283431 [Vespa mandarinia]|uniref:putative uncharacterized protein DDB_G0283431 n=1 Tax=Vespa mandarinia TaxID=7446 RepID=UPI00160A7B57|nr:putative uncharacterized protein DDB_G0283431 [Vespa mandarinia]